MTFKEYIERESISTDISFLNCINNGLIDLIGIENFSKLKYLNCGNNRITDLKGIENLTNLDYLSCYSNQITSLKEIDKLKNLSYLNSDITNDIEEARRLILPEIRKDKISDIDYDI